MIVTCSICQKDSDLYTEEVSVLLCGHSYHKRCLLQWLDDNSTFPKASFTTNDDEEKLDPSENENTDPVHKGSFDEARNILKAYEESNEDLQRVLLERIVAVENENLKLMNDLKSCSNDLQKCSDEKDALKKEVLSLKLLIERLNMNENDSEAKSKITLT